MMNSFKRLRLILVGVLFPILLSAQDTLTTPLPSDTLQSLPISIIGVGDIMFGTHFPSRIYLPPRDNCSPLLEGVSHILADADVTFGNLEGCFLNEGKVVKNCKDTTKCYAFKMPEHYVDCL